MADFINKATWIIILLFSCSIFIFSIVFLMFLPHSVFCKIDASIIEAVSNESLSSLGQAFGFSEGKLRFVQNHSDLLRIWSDEVIDHAPFYNTTALSEYIEFKSIRVTEGCHRSILWFEKCSIVLYYVSTVVRFSLLLQGILFFFCFIKLCSQSHEEVIRSPNRRLYRERIRTNTENSENCSTFNGSEIYANNLRVDSVITMNDSRISINTNIKPKQKLGAKKGILFSQCFRHVECDSDGEQVLNRMPSLRPRTTFKKDVDGTLSQDNVLSLYRIMSSVGIIFLYQESLGTVVRLGSHYIITAWHVIRNIVLPSDRSFHNRGIDVSLLTKDSVYIDFAPFCRQSPEKMHFKLKPNIVFMDEILDIAIVSLELDESKTLPEPICNLADVSSLKNDGKKVPCVHVIGKHPSKDLVVADTGCKLITRNDKRVKEAKKWMQTHMKDLKKIAMEKNENPNDVDTAYFDVSDIGRRLIFDTFLEFGGSGAAAISFLPEGPAIVAILIHGLPPNYWYSSSSYKFPDYMRMEVGCTMKAIFESQGWKDKEELRDAIFRYKLPPENMDTD